MRNRFRNIHKDPVAQFILASLDTYGEPLPTAYIKRNAPGLFGISEPAVRHRLTAMTEAGIIKRSGSRNSFVERVRDE